MGVPAKFNDRSLSEYSAWRLQAPRERLLQHAAPLLVEFDGFEQRLKIPLTETLVALALNDFEEDGADCVLGENLQQNAALVAAVDQNPAALKLGYGLTVPGHARIDAFVIGCGSILEFDAAAAQRVHGLVDVVGTERNVLDAFAFVLVQVLLDLALVVLAF